jgi:hypothetical protein
VTVRSGFASANVLIAPRWRTGTFADAVRQNSNVNRPRPRDREIVRRVMNGEADYDTKLIWCRYTLNDLFDGNQKSVETWLARNAHLSIDDLVWEVRTVCNLN